jgi:hypothetical protein
MRYKVIAKQYKQPGNLILRLEDGRVVREHPSVTGRHLGVGDTGIAVQSGNRTHFKPDAIDIECEVI